MPETLHLLCVTEHEPAWSQFALALNGGGCAEPRFRWASSVEIALTELRETSFDCLLIELILSKNKTASAKTDPLGLIRAIRAIGHDDPVVVISDSMDDRTVSSLLDLECEFIVSALKWESPVLTQMIQRAIAKTEIEKEHRQLSIERRRRITSDRQQAEHLLQQQQAIIMELAAGTFNSTGSTSASTAENSHDFLLAAYSDLLRTYVVMEPGSLCMEIQRLAEEMSQLGFSPQSALTLHHGQTQQLIDDLGEKSALHIVTRAGILGMELLAHLGECYRRKTSGS